MQIVECVPNFSEGRDRAVIDKIVETVATVRGAYLLHKDIGHAANRTVITFAGEPAAVVEAAFNAIACASRFIDMREHRGEHPRIGATDVCPLIPLKGISMSECVDMSMQLAKRVSLELKIPVYLYGESARFVERKNLAYLRKGGYESLAERLKGSEFKPDFGLPDFNARSGATVIGARKILIAYNLNLNTKDVKVAQSIARAIRRERQDHKMDAAQTPSANGAAIFHWQNCQAIGWLVEEYNCCQISMNLLDFNKSPLFDVYQAVSALAAEHNVKVTGSEIIGMVPLSALLKAGKSVIDRAALKNKGISGEQTVIDAAIKFLNLNQHQSFIANEKVLEYRLKELGLDPEIHL